ncbi:sigma factor-binding protein Crl [Photobacterium galatheae]|uniref:Sigma factor-binding protein Crl n=1 Tax=Photobacterium galatheae TaxID=1654360 RepID=A0A066RZ62_9GAMM|nr:sigma factor-binding protein Crl [Photobacterium galatheae]KDM92992.1 XRE family transcriptional regulator [Photobacterium galatheae]MCM0148481.1 sigma factor-binding protein Crl [Photobacterium galatheae]
MPTQVTFPSHGRLMTKLTALGPYLRQQQSSDGHFFFDCLASCINAKKEPEEREFWGWWLELTQSEGGFQYHYYFGRYDIHGDWLEDKVPAKHLEPVQQTLEDFYQKLSTLLEQEYALPIHPAPDLSAPTLSVSA